jgi:hypothetical protein
MAEFEQQLEKSLFKSNPEKSFVDKILAREDVNVLRSLIRKPRLTRQDLLEALYLLGGNEGKLVNYNEWDRYVILKFFVWIREFVKVTEMLFDYWENLKARMLPGLSTEEWMTESKVEKLNLTDDQKMTWHMLDNIQKMMEHNVKFVIDLYMNIARTSLSKDGTAFKEILNNRYEMVYPQGIPGQIATQQPQRGGFLGMFKRGG